MKQQEWSGRTYGSGWMHLWLVRLLKVTDVRILYVFIALAIIPVVLVFSRSRAVVYRFMRLRMGYGRMKSMWKTYISHCMFGQTVVDRFAMYAGKKFEVKVDGMEHMDRLMALPGAFLTMSSHIGNYELAGYTFRASAKRMNVLLFSGEKASVMENRRRMLEANNIGLIPVADDMSHLFEINRVLASGEVLGMAADRLNGSAKSIRKSFMGADVLLPQGPFSLATIRPLPVLAVDVLKTGSRQYTAYVSPLHYDMQAPRAEQMHQLSQAYTDNMDRMTSQYPTQWFNYFEFWI